MQYFPLDHIVLDIGAGYCNAERRLVACEYKLNVPLGMIAAVGIGADRRAYSDDKPTCRPRSDFSASKFKKIETLPIAGAPLARA